MKITDVKSSYLEVTLPKPGLQVAWDPGVIRKFYRYTVVQVFTDEGIVGIGGISGPGKELKVTIDLYVKPYLLGQVVDPFSVEKLSKMIHWWTHYQGPRTSCVEVALWDIIGKATKQPVHKLLGAAQEKVKAYISTCSLKEPKERAKDAVKLLDQGFKAMKIRLHNLDPRKDLEVVKAVRDAAGEEMEIICDANQAWTPTPPFWTRRTALMMARELEKHDVVWLEEPLFRDDLEGLAQLAASADIPIAGGELEFGMYRFKEYLEKGCYDIVQPDVTWSGGILETKKIAAMAQASNKLCVLCTWGFGLTLAANLQAVGSIPNCPYLEFGYEPPAWSFEVRDCLLKEPITAKDGYVEIPRGPGLGVDLNEKAVDKYTVD